MCRPTRVANPSNAVELLRLWRCVSRLNPCVAAVQHHHQQHATPGRQALQPHVTASLQALSATGLCHKANSVLQREGLQSKMARIRHTARKSTGGQAPRRQLARRSGLQCTYNAASADLRPANFEQVAEKEGFIACWDVALDLHATTHDALRRLQAPLLADLDPGLVAVLQSTDVSPCLRFYQDYNADGTYTLLAARNLDKGEPVGFYAGTLMEVEKFDVLMGGDLESTRHLFAYELDPEVLQKLGYDGPQLVISGLERANEFNFAQDAQWMEGMTNNLAAWLEWTRHEDGTPVPYVVFYAQRQIKQGEELLLDWGEGCWKVHMQIQVMKQSSKSHRMHLQQKRLEALCFKYDIDDHDITDALPRSYSDSGSDSDSDGSGKDHKRIRHLLRFNSSNAEYEQQQQQQKQQEQRQHQVQQAAAAALLPPGMDLAAMPAQAGVRASLIPIKPGGAAAPAALPGAAPDVLLDQGIDGDAAHGAVGASNAAGPSTASGAGTAATANGTGGQTNRLNNREQLAEQRKQQLEQQRRPPTPAPAEAFRKLASEEVAAVSGCSMVTSSDYSRLNNTWISQRDMDRVKQAQGDTTEAEEALIEFGLLPKMVVAEVLSLHHPVRWCTPPNVRAYTGLAAAVIQEGEALGAYLGEWWEDRQLARKGGADRQVYAYGVSKKELNGLCPALAGNWLDLAVDAMKMGNAARFLNCVWGHEEGATAANVEAQVVWSNRIKRPVVMLYATRRIGKDEELLVDYGPKYWGVVAKALMHTHAKYFGRMQDRLMAMRLLLEDADAPDDEVAAAEREDVDIETLQFFQP